MKPPALTPRPGTRSKETVVACVLLSVLGAPQAHQGRADLLHMTHGLIALCDWLKSFGVTHIGMESTGVYWRPVYNVPEDHFDLVVGNAHHIRNVPGRKTDVDRRSGTPWPDPGELCAAQGVVRAARTAALSPQDGRGAGGGAEPAAAAA